MLANKKIFVEALTLIGFVMLLIQIMPYRAFAGSASVSDSANVCGYNFSVKTIYVSKTSLTLKGID